jgi:hypothetical protein
MFLFQFYRYGKEINYSYDYGAEKLCSISANKGCEKVSNLRIYLYNSKN